MAVKERFEMSVRAVSMEGCLMIAKNLTERRVLTIPTTLMDNVSGIEADSFIVIEDGLASVAVDSRDHFLDNLLDYDTLIALAEPILDNFCENCPSILQKPKTNKRSKAKKHSKWLDKQKAIDTANIRLTPLLDAINSKS